MRNSARKARLSSLLPRTKRRGFGPFFRQVLACSPPGLLIFYSTWRSRGSIQMVNSNPSRRLTGSRSATISAKSFAKLRPEIHLTSASSATSFTNELPRSLPTVMKGQLLMVLTTDVQGTSSAIGGIRFAAKAGLDVRFRGDTGDIWGSGNGRCQY